MSTEVLRRRIDKLLAAIESLPEHKDRFLLSMVSSYLSDQADQEKLHAFSERVAPKIRIHPSGSLCLSDLSDQELNEGELWLKLGLSLKQGDSESAIIYQQQLEIMESAA